MRLQYKKRICSVLEGQGVILISRNADHFALSGNALKIIAALSMLIDHMGVVLFPDVTITRIIGRIAFPIYAFMIAEGCAYTKNRLRYFLTVFMLGVSCQVVYYLYDGSTYMGILITFSLSILVIYVMQYLKEVLFATESCHSRRCTAILLFLAVIAGVYFLNRHLSIDYGFWGCMTPVFASTFRKPASNPVPHLDRLDSSLTHVFMLGVGLIMVACISGRIQFYSLLALPLLMLYSGKRGSCKMKSFFYIFYPAHLVVLEYVSIIL